MSPVGQLRCPVARGWQASGDAGNRNHPDSRILNQIHESGNPKRHSRAESSQALPAGMPGDQQGCVPAQAGTRQEPGGPIPMSDSRFLSSSVYQPKLRMFYNGNNDVNVVRADSSASVAIEDPQKYEQVGDVRAMEAPTVPLDVRKRAQWPKDLSEDVLVSVF